MKHEKMCPEALVDDAQSDAAYGLWTLNRLLKGKVAKNLRRWIQPPAEGNDISDPSPDFVCLLLMTMRRTIHLSSLFKNGKIFQLANKESYAADYKEGAHMVPTPTTTGDLEPCGLELQSRLNLAWYIRKMRLPAEQRLFMFRKKLLPDYGLLEKAIRADLNDNDFKGLVGEILTEIMIEQCFSQFQIFFSNWRRTGHSSVEGMDILGMWDRDGRDVLTLVDSKFCGETSTTSFDTYVRNKIEQAFNGMEDYLNNEVKLARLHKLASQQHFQSAKSVIPIQKVSDLLLKPELQMNSASIVFPLSLNAKLLLQNPPSIVKSSQHWTALVLSDFSTCTFMKELV